MSGAVYLELFDAADVALLAAASGERGPDEERAARLRAQPERIEELLARPKVYERLFGAMERETFSQASPFLAFAVVVARASQDLRGAAFVEEWVGPGRRLPLFDIAPLRDFAALPQRRFFLVELLASFTHVASGSVRVRTRRGWRRQRYSELDLLRLAELATVVPAQERAAVLRRLGDLALFLAGVFPDHAGSALPPRRFERLRRILALDEAVPRDVALAAMGADAITMLEWLGQRAYQRAQDAWAVPEASLLPDVAARFREARRLLNVVTDRYLFPLRDRWFSVA